MDLYMRIMMQAQDAATSTINKLGKSISDLGGAMGPVGKAVAAVGVATVALGAASLKAAGDFQSGLTTLVTGAGESAANLKLVGDGIKQVSVDTGTSTKQLIDGMYMIESAGQHGAAGLNVLKVAAQGAKVGNADLGVTANALTTILTDYHMSADQSASAMNGLTATVASGKTKLQDLATAMGSVLPLASSLGISFPQVSGAIATMTNAGMSAQRASMNLANSIRSLAAPGGVATKALVSVGLTAQQLKDTLSEKGLTGAIQLVEDHVANKFPAGSVQAVNAFKAIMGGATGYNVALMVGGKNMATYENNVKNITNAMQNGKGAVTGWAAVQDTFNLKIDQAKQALNVFLISLGQQLLPIMSKVVGAITPIISGFSQWVSSSNGLSGILTKLSTLISSTVGPAFKTFMDNVVNGEAGGILIGIFQNLGTIILKLGSIVSQVSPTMQIFGNVFKNFSVKTALTDAVNLFVNAVYAISAPVQAATNAISGFADWLQKGGLPAQVFKDALIGVGVALAVIKGIAIVSAIADFIEILPIIIGLTWAWAGGLAAAAVSAVIAAAPFIAIGVAIAAVVAIVILAVQHWGQIVEWLKGVWGNISTFFANLWAGVVHWFQSAWGTILNILKGIGIGIFIALTGPIGLAVLLIATHTKEIGKFFSDLGSNIHKKADDAAKGFQNAMGGLGNWFQQRGKDIQQTAQNIGKGVVDAGNWMYNHNYYWKMMVDGITAVIHNVQVWLKLTWKTISDDAIAVWSAITGWLTNAWNVISGVATTVWNAVSGAIETAAKAVWDWLVMAWTTVTGWLSAAWKAVSGVATTAWNAVTKAIQTGVTIAWNWLVSVWTTISGWLSAQWNKFTTLASQVWAAVSAVFASIWSKYISGPLTALWNQISGWFGQLAKGAQQSGQNFINMLVSGIQNGAGAIWNAVKNIASTIWTALGFHSPPKGGPLADSDEYMPNMIKMLSSQLVAGAPKMAHAASVLAQPLTMLAPSSGPVSSPVAPLLNQSSGHTFNNTITINSTSHDPRTQATQIKNELAKLLRGQGVQPNFTSGGTTVS